MNQLKFEPVLLQGNAIDKLKQLEDCSVDCCVTSPPYYGLRDYGTGEWIGGDSSCDHKGKPFATKSNINRNCGNGVDRKNAEDTEPMKSVCSKCGAIRVDEQIGLEETPEEYIEKLVDVFREVRRVLHDDGTLWVNIADSYSGGGRGCDTPKQRSNAGTTGMPKSVVPSGCKPKDLIGIPWLLAFELRADGWHLRQEIIWCLSGGAYVYAKTQKGEFPTMIRDLVRLDPKTVKLWNGEKWTQVLGWGESRDVGDKLEIVLRSGERVGCTESHEWPTNRGVIKAHDIRRGDIIRSCALPEPSGSITPNFLTDDILWMIGLYLAEGSMSEDTIQISLNTDEIEWVDRIRSAARDIGATVTHSTDGNGLNVRIYGRIVRAVISEYIGGRTAVDKHLSNAAWRLPNAALRLIVDGYLDGDGHHDISNNRWRLGFCRNYALEQSLRTCAARLGATLVLKPSVSKCQSGEFKSFRGEWRWERSGHFNESVRSEVVDIRKSRARHFWDISVEDEPNLFALASGILTHNCKPNPMPESVTDRCTKSHESIFLLSKSARYYFDAKAIAEPTITRDDRVRDRDVSKLNNRPGRTRMGGLKTNDYETRNKRDVWTMSSQPFSGAHFATFPMQLPETCILAGSKIGGTVLDPFNGAGTTGIAAMNNGRNYIGIDLNAEYLDITRRRFAEEVQYAEPLF